MKSEQEILDKLIELLHERQRFFQEMGIPPGIGHRLDETINILFWILGRNNEI